MRFCYGGLTEGEGICGCEEVRGDGDFGLAIDTESCGGRLLLSQILVLLEMGGT